MSKEFTSWQEVIIDFFNNKEDSDVVAGDFVKYSPPHRRLSNMPI